MPTRYLFGTILTGEAVAANNRGDNLGNTTTLQKVFVGDDLHTSVSAEAIRFAFRYRFQLEGLPVNRTYDADKGVLAYADEKHIQWDAAKTENFIDDDLMGFMLAEAAKSESEEEAETEAEPPSDRPDEARKGGPKKPKDERATPKKPKDETRYAQEAQGQDNQASEPPRRRPGGLPSSVPGGDLVQLRQRCERRRRPLALRRRDAHDRVSVHLRSQHERRGQQGKHQPSDRRRRRPAAGRRQSLSLLIRLLAGLGDLPPHDLSLPQDPELLRAR